MIKIPHIFDCKTFEPTYEIGGPIRSRVTQGTGSLYCEELAQFFWKRAIGVRGVGHVFALESDQGLVFKRCKGPTSLATALRESVGQDDLRKGMKWSITQSGPYRYLLHAGRVRRYFAIWPLLVEGVSERTKSLTPLTLDYDLSLYGDEKKSHDVISSILGEGMQLLSNEGFEAMAEHIKHDTKSLLATDGRDITMDDHIFAYMKLCEHLNLRCRGPHEIYN